VMQMYARYSGRRRSVTELISEIEAVSRSDVQRVANGVALDTVYFLRDKEA
jgi:predicted Zn-dependent peptidase